MKISEMVQRAHDMSKSKGWWDECLPSAMDEDGRRTVDRGSKLEVEVCPNILGSKLALIHSEVSEALECVRDGQMRMEISESGKPEGLPTELADVVIRIGDLCGALGIDLEEAVRIKMEYNGTRRHRHGGRAL